MAKLRTFICFELPVHVIETLAELQESLRPLSGGVRWTRPKGIHLTLKFLGDVDEESLPAVAQAVKVAASSTSAFDIQVIGAGAFPNIKRPRVFWVGVSEPSGELQRLQERIETALQPLGFERETRKFSPHLTIGRVKFADHLKRITDFFETEPLAPVSFSADELVIMKSELKPGGAVYTPLHTIQLKPS